MKLESIAEIVSGTTQFRIKESFEENAPVYIYYSQSDLQGDLHNDEDLNEGRKQVRTFDEVSLLHKDDVVFSLISGKASLVHKIHEGYLYTQNYVKIIPADIIDSKYLVFCLNEDNFVRKQLQLGLQGSMVMKYSLKQVKELQIPELPPMDKQECIGTIYQKQRKLQNLKKHAADMEAFIRVNKLKEVVKNDRKSI